MILYDCEQKANKKQTQQNKQTNNTRSKNQNKKHKVTQQLANKGKQKPNKRNELISSVVKQAVPLTKRTKKNKNK